MIITNEVEPLSNDLTRLTTEIKTYQSIGGQAIFEIGRRLNWVKKHDLAHGEYLKWLKTIGMNRHIANKFMTVAIRLSNGSTSNHLGLDAMYLIATMPPEERDKPQQLPNGEMKKPEDMTVRELRETKRRLKQREKELSDKDAQIADQQAELEDNRKTQLELSNRLAEANKRQPEPKVVTKTVTKEVHVKPDDYDTLKQRQSEYEQKYERLTQSLEAARAKERDARNEMKSLAKEHDELERKYQEASQAISDNQVEWAKNKSSYSTYRLASDSNDFITKHKPLDFQIEELANASSSAKEQLEKSITELINFATDIKTAISGKRIIEGEMIDHD